MEAYQWFGIGWNGGYGECKFWDVDDVEPDAHVCVREIGFCHEYWAEVWVGFRNAAQYSWQCASELHGFDWSCLLDRVVQATEGVVIDWPVTAVVLRYAG
jgi:hypothetical protein